MAVEAGEKFPEFSGPSYDGKVENLADLRAGRNLVVFFFPKGTSPGCVRETTEFASRKVEFDQLNTQIVGISLDNSELQKDHAIQCAANFPILSDVGAKLTTDLGIVSERGTARRTTYLIDTTGAVRRVFADVKVDGHVDEVFEVAKRLREAPPEGA